MDKLYIIKISGNIINDEQKLSSFLHSFAFIQSPKILVHGGGKSATKLAAQLGIEQQMIDGRRITNAETLKIVTMVYAGLINKNIVAKLQAEDCAAIGLCGADGNLIQAHKRGSKALSFGEPVPIIREGLGEVNYGFAGDIDAINSSLLQNLLSQNLSIVIAPITHDKKGQLLNTNADTIAQEMAQAMSSLYEVHLIYSFEKSGVLLNAGDDSTIIPSISLSHYKELKEQGIIFAGMIPKLDNAFAALQKGVHRVIIGKAEDLAQLISGKSGTSIIHE